MAKILILDDNRDILRMMEFTLTRAGHQPIVASNGREGLEIIKRDPPQLIIADIMMPEMTGYDFTRQVRNMDGQAELPILIYSARAQSVDRQAALDAGATDYIPKNVSPTEIIEKINSILGEDKETQTGQQATKMIACFSTRGGVGITSLAVNIAVILSMAQKTETCLIDMNPVAGHANLMLGLQPQTNLYTLLASDDPLSPAGIKTFLTGHKSRVQVLASPQTVSEQAVNHTIQDVITAVQPIFRFIIFDLPHVLDADQRELLADLDRLIIPVAPDALSIQSASATIAIASKAGISKEKITLVLNHPTPVSTVAKDKIQQVLPLPLAVEVPYDQSMADAVATGNPLVLHNPKSPTAAALARLAATLIK